MRKGEIALLKCAPDYAYGKNGIGPIPPSSTLFFEVELLDWSDKPNGGDGGIFYVGIALCIISLILYYIFNTIYPKKHKA